MSHSVEERASIKWLFSKPGEALRISDLPKFVETEEASLEPRQKPMRSEGEIEKMIALLQCPPTSQSFNDVEAANRGLIQAISLRWVLGLEEEL